MDTGTKIVLCHKACDEVTGYVPKSYGGECRIDLSSDISIFIAIN